MVSGRGSETVSEWVSGRQAAQQSAAQRESSVTRSEVLRGRGGASESGEARGTVGER
jgi:hypothetical protein